MPHVGDFNPSVCGNWLPIINNAAPLVKPVKTGWLIKLTNLPILNTAINNIITPLSADKIIALCNGFSSAATSGDFNATAIMIAAIETGPTESVRLVPKNA